MMSNKDNFIAHAIQSVLNQTYINLEIIIVDDGSQDNSFEIVKEYANNDIRISWHSQKNQGVFSCRNRGISESRGKYIIFLDGDDYLYPDYVQTAVSYMELNSAVDYLHVGWDYIDYQGETTSTVHAVAHDDYLFSLLLGNLFAIHCVFCRMAHINRVGLFNKHLLSEDWEYWIRCAVEGGVFKNYSSVSAATRVHAGSKRRIVGMQQYRFFPIIDKIFHPDFNLPHKYRNLESLSRLRHHVFLYMDYIRWGWDNEAQEQFDIIIESLGSAVISTDFKKKYIYCFLNHFTPSHRQKLRDVFNI